MMFPGSANAFVKRARHQVSAVSEDGMSAAAFTLPEQIHRESLVIVQGLRHRDADLLDQLIVEHQQRLLRYLLYLTGNRDTAEELFQETWMRVLTHGAQFQGNSKFATWLFSIARNLVIDTCRRRRPISLEAMCETNGDKRPFEVVDDNPSPFERYQTQETAHRVDEALLSLAPSHREVLVLRFHGELSIEEIANVIQEPLSTIKSRLYRGIAALRRRIPRERRAKRSAGSKCQR
jgi:RNA polymerase sigma-70 factor, ECF subfamily